MEGEASTIGQIALALVTLAGFMFQAWRTQRDRRWAIEEAKGVADSLKIEQERLAAVVKSEQERLAVVVKTEAERLALEQERIALIVRAEAQRIALEGRTDRADLRQTLQINTEVNAKAIDSANHLTEKFALATRQFDEMIRKEAKKEQERLERIDDTTQETNERVREIAAANTSGE